jgi:WD40 repeat protein
VTATFDFSQIIRTERVRRGLTQSELGERVGVSDSYIAHLESGLKTPSPNLALSLADEFGFTLQQRQALLRAVENARLERTSKRIRTRGRAIRGALQRRAPAAGGLVLIADPMTGSPGVTMPLRGRALRLLCFSPNGRLLAGSDEEGTTTVWDLASAEPERIAEFSDSPLSAITFAGDERIAGVDEDARLLCWHVDGTKVAEIESGSERIVVLAASSEPDVIAVGDEDGQLTVWNTQRAKPLWKVDAHPGSLDSIAFAPAGDRVATGAEADGAVRVWHASNGKEERRLRHEGGVFALCYSPDGRWLAGAGTGMVVLWNAEDPSERRALHGPRSALLRLAFHPEGVLLTGVAIDGSVFTWDTRTATVRRNVRVAGGPFLAHALSANARRLAVFDARKDAGDGELDAEAIARELARDRELLAAWRDVRAGLADPAMRETVLNALRAFARRS